jgi:peptide/nickel transport system substrate-binding protein
VAGYENAEVDAMFAQAAVAATSQERQEIYTDIQQQVVDDAPVAWLLEIEFPTIYRCNVENLVTTAIGVNDGLRDAWIEQ